MNRADLNKKEEALAKANKKEEALAKVFVIGVIAAAVLFFGTCVWGVVSQLVNRPQPDAVKMQSERMQREMEERRQQDALELHIRLKALELDQKKNPGR
jgi:hypothetical protein